LTKCTTKVCEFAYLLPPFHDNSFSSQSCHLYVLFICKILFKLVSWRLSKTIFLLPLLLNTQGVKFPVYFKGLLHKFFMYTHIQSIYFCWFSFCFRMLYYTFIQARPIKSIKVEKTIIHFFSTYFLIIFFYNFNRFNKFFSSHKTYLLQSSL
jgi:hypothetical protein